MRVSLSLHTDEPSLDDNQQQHEARYGGFNRLLATLTYDKNGNGVLRGEPRHFPVVLTDPEVFTHWSVADANGGAIIIVGPVQGKNGEMQYPAEIGKAPVIYMEAGIFAARMEELGLTEEFTRERQRQIDAELSAQKTEGRPTPSRGHARGNPLKPGSVDAEPDLSAGNGELPRPSPSLDRR